MDGGNIVFLKFNWNAPNRNLQKLNEISFDNNISKIDYSLSEKFIAVIGYKHCIIYSK